MGLNKRPLFLDLNTPLQYVDRNWLRRLTLIAITIPCLFLYMGSGLFHWFNDFAIVWRGKE